MMWTIPCLGKYEIVGMNFFVIGLHTNIYSYIARFRTTCKKGRASNDLCINSCGVSLLYVHHIYKKKAIFSLVEVVYFLCIYHVCVKISHRKHLLVKKYSNLWKSWLSWFEMDVFQLSPISIYISSMIIMVMNEVSLQGCVWIFPLHTNTFYIPILGLLHGTRVSDGICRELTHIPFFCRSNGTLIFPPELRFHLNVLLIMLNLDTWTLITQNMPSLWQQLV